MQLKKYRKIASLSFILIIAAFTVLLIITNSYYTKEPIVYIVLADSILITLVFFILTFATIRINRNIMFEAQNEKMSQQFFLQLEHQHLELRKFRHDYLNILLTLSHYIRDKEMDQLERYFKEEILPTHDVFADWNLQLKGIEHLATPEIKSILTVKMMVAQEKGIKIIANVGIREHALKIKGVDFARMMGIIFDNAIEAAEHCAIPLIELNVLETEEYHVFSMRNSYNGTLPSLNKLNTKGYSTKGGHRGLGLCILQELLNKYDDACLETNVEEGFFTQTLEVKKGAKLPLARHIQAS